MRAEVSRVGPDDWAAWRDLRLEALQDTPIAFVRTYDESVGLPEQHWRELLARRGCSLLARAGEVPVAMAAAWQEEGVCWLGAVYVTPSHRGTGLLARMLEPCAAWARERGERELRLEVHEDNPAAIAAYARLGFVATGERRPYPLAPDRDELVMTLRLA